MICITVVDDSHLDRMLIAGLLKAHGDYHFELAENGKEALEKIRDAPPHLVVTDLVMPEMDGLQLVRELDRQFPDIPVILMTAYGNESLAVQALESGAASYVPKARQAERLVETVDRVLARARTERHRHRLLECMSELHCRYSLENDPGLLTPLIDEIQQRLAGICGEHANQRVRTVVALEEAILNAMYHGNLEISESELALARADAESGDLTQLVEQQRGLPEYRDRKIELDIHITADGARFVVRDQGPGFDPPAAEDMSNGECFESGHHRGLKLMHSLMDEVAFNRAGNEVTLVKHARR